jgi:hypothetical protein
MDNLRRKLRAVGEAAEHDGGMRPSAAERVSPYSVRENGPLPIEDTMEAAAEPAYEEPTPEAGVTADLAGVGEEVGVVLKSAHEAAGRLRLAAHEEAERLRSEAESAAAAVLEEARRTASADLAAASQMRAKMEAWAKDARASADAYVEERLREAEQTADQIVSDAQKVLAAADAEVEQKVREADAKARDRRQVLELETDRYERRLQHILAAFLGMSSQLEDLVARREAESGDLAGTLDEALHQALQPDLSTAHVE